MEPETEPLHKPDVEWIKDLQKNSWEPEVIISGLTLAFIFSFPAKIYEFSAGLIQDSGLDYLGAYVVLIYISWVINLFKIFLIIHLCLRFAWTGLLGLSYAFPEGVKNDRLFKVSKDYEYSHPLDMVLKMERLCSMAFAFPLMMGMIVLIFTCYLVLLLFTYKVFDLNFFTIYLIFLVSLIIFSIWQLTAKKSNLKKRMARTIFSTISATYQSNVGKWAMLGYMLLTIIIAKPFVDATTKNFSMFFKDVNLSEEQLEWPNPDWYFNNRKDPDKRFARILIPTEEVNGDFLPIKLAYYDGDDELLSALSSNIYKQNLDTISWAILLNVPDLYSFYINDSLIKTDNWRKSRMENSDQKILQGLTDISHLPLGVHEFRVEKLTLTPNIIFKAQEIRMRKNWAKFNFVKIS